MLAKNCRLFSLYNSSYKHFKIDFFNVRSSPEELAFFLNPEGKPKYPLYWTCSPFRVANTYNELTPTEKEEFDFLTQLAHLDCQALLKLPYAENHKESWQRKREQKYLPRLLYLHLFFFILD